MPSSEFRCPKCSTRFRVDNKYLGRVAACPKSECGQKMKLTAPKPNAAVTSDSPTARQPAPASSQPSPRKTEVKPAAAPATPSKQPAAAVQKSAARRKSPMPAAAPRQSRTERLARQNEVARRRQSTSPRSKSKSVHIHPAWYGAVVGLLIGGAALYVWSGFSAMPDSAASEIAANDVAAEDTVVFDAAGKQAIPVSMPAKSPEQIAADQAAAAEAQKVARRTEDLQQRIIPFLNKHCADCHGPDSQEAGIEVHKLASVDQFLTERRTWERVYRMINSGAMPPSDYDPMPAAEEREAVSTLMHDELYNFDCDLVYNPGRSTVQRLNKAEYNNTIQDLFDIKITPADKFPADDVGDGFDNIGDVLSLPPLLMEKYLSAAEEITDVVIDSRDYSKPRHQTALGEDFAASNGSKDFSAGFRILASHGEVSHDFDIGATGDYEIKIKALADQAGNEKARFAVKLGDNPVKEFDVQAHRKPEDFSLTTQLTAGSQKIAVEFLNDFYDGKAKKNNDRNLGVASITVSGPIGGGIPVRHAMHQRIVTAVPGNGTSTLEAAQTVLRPVMNRAFRRDVSDAEVFRYAGLVRRAVEDMGETYEGGLAMALQAILVAPDFLFRLERDPVDGETERQLDDFEVASRLSYFLWSSMPDEELFQLARTQQLRKPDMMRQQLQRMLKHDKAEALVQNFAAQWLNLRNLNDVNPNTDVFKSFNDGLRRDMRRETELLFRTVMQEDRNVEELLSADFTFVNKRLARHYGIEGVDSDEFQRVSLQGTNRAGVLTHASILTLTSNPGRTSPVKRGKWIMENIFGEAPPPPPPGVPELEETAKVSPDLSLREQLAKHREDPGCAACHKVMDPLGLGLENFDAIGQWRDKDGKRKIDASGSLPSGETFDGPIQLIGIVRKQRQKFLQTLSQRMLTYAIGRATEYYDQCTIDRCVHELENNGGRFSVLIENIVTSDPFLKRTIAQD